MPGTPSQARDTGPDGVPGWVPEPVPEPPLAAPSSPSSASGPWSDPDVAFYTVGQVGDLLGVPAATLRRFDLTGAVRPARSSGGQRRYSQRQLEQAGRLLRLVDEGLTLAAATRVADLEDTVADLRQQLADAADERSD